LGMDFEAFSSNPVAIAAVQRKLQIISEAAIRLGSEAERRCPDQPWADIRGVGNQLRHAYERIDLETVWSTVTDDLPPLKASVLRGLDSWPRKLTSPSLERLQNEIDPLLGTKTAVCVFDSRMAERVGFGGYSRLYPLQVIDDTLPRLP
jgi:uncharacterized protein with HEPN domain